MQILNIIEWARGKAPSRRRLEDIDRIVVHRCGKDLKYGHDLGDTGPEICDAFVGRVPKWREVARAVGYRRPYSFLVSGGHGNPVWDGVVWQSVALLAWCPDRRSKADLHPMIHDRFSQPFDFSTAGS